MGKSKNKKSFRMNKLEKLKEYLINLESVVVAFSSGVDSTFLLKIAHDTLKDNVIAITAKSRTFPERELSQAIEFCKKEKIKHIILDSNELEIEDFRKNPPNRCYICKKDLFSKILEIAEKNDINNVLEGSNLDDDNDYRPGFIAIRELGIKSPLKELKFTKKEIRELSKSIGLDTFDKPSFACLASRFVYGEEITPERLGMVEKAEQFLLDMGFFQVRVRIHNSIARIEVLPEEFDKIIKNRNIITEKFKEIGFSYITMDLIGYRTGSMNETLAK